MSTLAHHCSKSSQHSSTARIMWFATSLACVGSIAPAGAQVTGEAQSRDMRGVEEIIVTAQKRKERLQDVPISISVLTGQALDKSTDRGVGQALNRVSGVSTQIDTTATRLGSTGGFVVVRGVSPASGLSPTAYYLDSIPFGFTKPGSPTLAPDASGYDLERVEVLRGPQGTLYGSSALNGVVRVLTRDANPNAFEFNSRLSSSSTEDGGINYRGDVMVNAPIVEGKLAVRGVVGYQYLSGWIDKSFDDDANDVEMKNYRLKVAAQPMDNMSIDALAWASRADTGAPSNSIDGRVSESPVPEPSSIDYDAYGLRINYDFDTFSATSSTSYLDYQNHSTFDFAPFTIVSANSNSRFDSKVFSEELIFSSTAKGNWRWSVGGFYRDAEDLQLLERRNPATGALMPPYLAPNISRATSRSYAAFGELTRLFWDGRLELTAGGRYFKDRVRDNEVSRRQCVNGIPVAGNCPTQPTPEPLGFTEGSFDNVSPRLALTWHPDDQMTLYASYGEGFRSGFNQSFVTQQAAPGYPPVDPDTLRNYEIGVKGSMWDNRFNVDAAVFFVDWQDVQMSRLVDISAVVGTPFIISVFDNAGSASGYGFDLAISTELVDGLTIGGAFSWNDLEVDADVTSATDDGPVILFSKGDRLNNSAKYTIGANVDFVRPLGRFSGRFSGSANYLSDVITSRTDPTITTPSVPFTTMDGYWMTRASIGLESPNGWTAALFVDNLGNQDGISRDEFSPRWNSWVRPRTIGLQVDYRY